MPRILVVGGGLAGMAATAALGEAGYGVELLEARGYLGGRASSYPMPGGQEGAGHIDNCQHVLLRGCVHLLDLYRRLGVADRIAFDDMFHFLEPGGRRSTLAGSIPSFLKMRCLGVADKLAVIRALEAMRRIRGGEPELERISMLDWLREKRQPERAIRRFWRQVLVSAVNEELDRMAASHGIQVFRLGWLAGGGAHQMGLPKVPLGDLYASCAWRRLSSVRIHLRRPVERILVDRMEATGVSAGGETLPADAVICAVPFERVPALVPELGLDLDGWQHSPITGIHLWFDRPVTGLPHATLLDRTIQWFFNKGGGRYLLVVVSASRGLLEMGRQEIVDLAVRELAEFLAPVRSATLVRAYVVKEVRATFSARPGLEARRPPAVTAVRSLFLAGDWTRTGWPATMEGAVRSGYMAAEAVLSAAGRPERFLLPGIS